jgi:DNA polymerase-1
MIKNRLVLIDSFALIYRAFYGIPATLTRDGHPINAAYGFASAILAAIKELQPEYLVACFDLPKPTKRHLEYVDYKATRKPMPDDLIPQIQYCKKILETMNIPVISAEGYEGEDVIATIVAQQSDFSNQTSDKVRSPKSEVRKPVNEFIIVTGDSDTFQLIDKVTKVYSMARGAQHAVLYDELKVKERYNVNPNQFVDLKALKGDTSDNIPGVPGIGEKTASSLIQKFGTLDKLYDSISKSEFLISNQTPNGENLKKMSKSLEISEKILSLLIEYKDQAFLSRKLSQIVSDAPIEFDLASSRIHDFDKVKVEKLFLELGFKSLIARMPVSTRTNNQQVLF